MPRFSCKVNSALIYCMVYVVGGFMVDERGTSVLATRIMSRQASSHGGGNPGTVEQNIKPTTCLPANITN